MHMSEITRALRAEIELPCIHVVIAGCAAAL